MRLGQKQRGRPKQGGKQTKKRGETKKDFKKSDGGTGSPASKVVRKDEKGLRQGGREKAEEMENKKFRAPQPKRPEAAPTRRPIRPRAMERQGAKTMSQLTLGGGHKKGGTKKGRQ